MTDPQTISPTNEALANEERALRQQEFAARREEARLKLEGTKRPWWRGTDPLVLAVVAGIFTLGGNMYVAYFNSRAALEQEKEKAHNALDQVIRKADNDLALEREKAKASLILKAVSTDDPDVARRNMLFFLDGGLIEDTDRKIRNALAKYAPVLPSSSGQANLSPPSSNEDYERYFWSANIRPEWISQADAALEKLIAGRPRLERVAQATGTPWYLIGVFWLSETGGRFSVHLHNGDPLTGPTVNAPSGRPPDWPPAAGQDPWEFSAADAVRLTKLDNLANAPIGEMLARLERVNGIGYQKRGLMSPYLWSGTDLYEKGKFGSDAGGFNPNAVSKQIGLATVLRRLQDRKIINIPGAAASASATSDQDARK